MLYIIQKLQLFITYRLMMAWSAESRKTRGLGFPSCAFGVIVPTSTNPNPNLYKPSTASPCLSKPAAMPTGFLNFNPKTFISCRKRTFLLCVQAFWRHWNSIASFHRNESDRLTNDAGSLYRFRGTKPRRIIFTANTCAVSGPTTLCSRGINWLA